MSELRDSMEESDTSKRYHIRKDSNGENVMFLPLLVRKFRLFKNKSLRITASNT